MKIKKRSINKIILSLLIILSFLSYEKNVYTSMYSGVIFVVFFLGVILFLINATQKFSFANYLVALKYNKRVHFLSIIILISTFVSSIKHSMITLNGLISVVLTIASFYIFYLYIPLVVSKDFRKFKRLILYIITISSIVAIYIEITGSFISYSTYIGRAVSIYIDPNFFGTLAAVGFILSFVNLSSRSLIFSTINLFGVYLSGSRGAMLSLAVTILVFYFYKRKFSVKSTAIFITLLFVLYFGFDYLYNSGFFRMSQGLSSRNSLWRLALGLFRNEMFWGYGYGSLRDIFINQGATSGSSHNSYIDYILMYGIFTFTLYISIIIRGLKRGLKNRVPDEVSKVIIVLLVNANTISINLGGLGAMSLILTLFLGIANASPYSKVEINHMKGVNNGH